MGLFSSKFKLISSILDKIVFDDLDKAKRFKDYFSSVHENDNGRDLMCKREGLSVLEAIAFDVTDVLKLLGKLDGR